VSIPETPTTAQIHYLQRNWLCPLPQARFDLIFGSAYVSIPYCCSGNSVWISRDLWRIVIYLAVPLRGESLELSLSPIFRKWGIYSGWIKPDLEYGDRARICVSGVSGGPHFLILIKLEVDDLAIVRTSSRELFHILLLTIDSFWKFHATVVLSKISAEDNDEPFSVCLRSWCGTSFSLEKGAGLKLIWPRLFVYDRKYGDRRLI
jgi:hypothetical protein